jgi:competence protein ComEA
VWRSGVDAPPTTGAAAADPLSIPDLPYAGTTAAAATSATTATSPKVLVVHAAGAVAHPGVYQLAEGDRVGDLVEAAGGLTPDADGDRLNLAAPLTDGVRLYVPRRGEPDQPVVAPLDHGGTAPTDVSTDVADAPIDLNSATVAQLEDLPGVGPSIAAAIVEHREQSGPFASVDELLDVRGIGPARLEQLRPLVRVG